MKDSIKVKRIRNYILKFLSVFPVITKNDNFWWKNADVSWNQGVHCVAFIFFGSSLGNV